MLRITATLAAAKRETLFLLAYPGEACGLRALGAHMTKAAVFTIASMLAGCGLSTGPVIATVTINPSSLTLNGLGVTGLMVAAVLDERGIPISNAVVTWTSENISVATIGASGLSTTVTSVAAGTATIRATAGTVSGTGTVIVAARVLSVTIAPPVLTLRVGETGQMTATVIADPGVATTPTWETSAPNVASVSNGGLVTAVGRGSATITARSTADPTKTAAASITSLGVASVTIVPKPLTLERGSTQQMTVTVVADAGISTAVTWRSTDLAAVSISSAGLVTAMNPGAAYVVATSTAESAKRDSALVTVPDACQSPAAYTLGVTVNGAITAADCNGRSDHFDHATSAVTFFSVTLSAMQTLFLFPVVGVDWSSGAAGVALTLYALVSAGAHRLRVSTASDTTQRGSYTLSSALNPAFPPDCPSVWTTVGVTRSFALDASCPFTAQRFFVAVPMGRTFRATAVAAAFPARIELRLGNSVLASGLASGPNAPAILTYTPPPTIPESQLRVLQLVITSNTPGVTGSFTITIDP